MYKKIKPERIAKIKNAAANVKMETVASAVLRASGANAMAYHLETRGELCIIPDAAALFLRSVATDMEALAKADVEHLLGVAIPELLTEIKGLEGEIWLWQLASGLSTQDGITGVTPEILERHRKEWETAAIRAVAAEADLAERTCEWEEYEGMWRPGCCGETWEFTDGGPRENAVTHCMFCGGPMIFATGKDGE